ncbi:MAG: UDP-N-acetylglucosamine 4,6-dehydratase (inverting) [Candidatus Omnitrophica bacterium]|nr:UDP-N-acetylglucosamine 4,6-dehydratase (inverting) [Candidatus Omnitrophota bacterium]
MSLNGKIILLTGGTGSFGQKFTEIVLKKFKPEAIRIFSRDELKQWEMEKKFNNNEHLRFFIGDIRDRERLERAMDSVDIVVHAAALKQVPSCEYNPFEAVKTNIIGAQNIIDAAIDNKVHKVMALSTDKAVNPINLYGATKLCAEKIFVQGNSYSGKSKTKFSCVRYGNVIGSRGSVIPKFKEQKKSGELTITDKRMTRFWITLEQGVNFVIKCIEMMNGGEVFVPKIPSMKILDLANLILPDCKIKQIGIRPGEKMHEALVTEDEARHTREFEGYYIIEPDFHWWSDKNFKGGKKLNHGFRYSSDQNPRWLTKSQMKKLLKRDNA